MKRTSIKLWLAAAAVALAASVTPAHALNPQPMDIHVSISNTKNLTVSSTYYNFGALAVNTSSVSAAIDVTNPIATGLIETYTIKGDTATADGGGTNWVLAASTAADQYALAAQFGTSAAADLDTAWDQDDLNSDTAITATQDILGNGAPSESGASVLSGDVRTLRLRIRTPNIVSDPGHHKAVVTLSVL